MAYMGTGKHLDSDDPEPDPPAKDVLRVYGMKFCPFVQRLKLVMHAKGIDHESVNCNLRNKPKWLLSKNPREKVPVLELNGNTLYESDIIARYIDDVFPGNRRLATTDPWRRAEEHMLMGDLDKSISGFYGLARAGDEEKRKDGFDRINAGFTCLESHLQKYSNPFIGGERPGITDYMFWPFLERMSLLMMCVIQRQPTVMKYYELMSADPTVMACRHPEELHKQFIETYKTGNSAYDIGDADNERVVTMCRSASP